MNKAFFMPYLCLSILGGSSLLLFILYQSLQYGICTAIFLGVIVWSMYVLCIPAAHGRFLFSWISSVIAYPELICWLFAVFFNVIVLIKNHEIYQYTILTYLFYRIFTQPHFWILFLSGAIGSWYRVLFLKGQLYNRYLHTIIRHLIFLFGIVFFFYMTHFDLIVMINSMANG